MRECSLECVVWNGSGGASSYWLEESSLARPLLQRDWFCINGLLLCDGRTRFNPTFNEFIISNMIKDDHSACFGVFSWLMPSQRPRCCESMQNNIEIVYHNCWSIQSRKAKLLALAYASWLHVTTDTLLDLPNLNLLRLLEGRMSRCARLQGHWHTFCDFCFRTEMLIQPGS